MNSNAQSDLTISRNLVTALMDRIKGGESCALLGVSGVGKSALLRRLQQHSLKRHYLGDAFDRFLFIIVDCNMLTEVSAWGAFELMLRRLADGIPSAQSNPENTGLRESLGALYQESQAAHDRALAQRNLSRALRQVFDAGFLKVIFFLDEFDSLLTALDAQFLNNLRGVRDEFRPNIVYVTLTRRVFPILRSDIKETAEGFNEMFRSTFALRPYTREEARLVLGEMMAMAQFELHEDEIGGLIRATGGHAALLKAGFEYLRKNRAADAVNLNAMSANPIIADEARKILESLDQHERRVLAQVSRHESIAPGDGAVAEHLKVKGLVVDKGGTYALFAPLVAEYVKRQIEFNTR